MTITNINRAEPEHRFYIYSRSEDGTQWLDIGSTFSSWCTDRCEATGFLSEAAAIAEAAEYNHQMKSETRHNDAMRTRAMVMKRSVPVWEGGEE